MVLQKTNGLPEQGQSVTMRQRLYDVVDVEPGNLPIQPLPVQPKAGQNLLMLNWIEDDARTVRNGSAQARWAHGTGVNNFHAGN